MSWPWWLALACAPGVEPSSPTESDSEPETGVPAALAWDDCQSSYTLGELDEMDELMAFSPTVSKDEGWFSIFGSDGRHRIARATVEDGLFLDPQVALDASVVRNPSSPALLVHGDGQRSLFLDGTGDAGTVDVWRCEEAEDGRWTGCEVVLEAGSHGTYDTLAAQIPFVLPLDEGYRLFYTGLDDDGWRRILTATSSDGWTWSTPEVAVDMGAEGTYDDRSVYSAFVWPDASGYRMLYAGRAEHEGYEVKRLIEAWSTDAESWSRHTMTVDLGCAGDGDAWRVDAPWVVPEGDGWRLYYDGFDDPITTEGQRSLFTAVSR